jgi:hypothetical protein
MSKSNGLKSFLESILPDFLLEKYFDRKRAKAIKAWKKNGSPLPPPHLLKQQVIKDLGQQYDLKTLVETGTYLGHMVDAQKRNFSKIISIELSPDLARQAQEKFSKDAHIEILEGDSGQVIKEIVPQLTAPALFWLDGHFSEGITAKGDKDTPVMEELDTIIESKLNHIIIIDDARHFNGEKGYPSIQDLRAQLKKSPNSYRLEVKDDIIRIIQPN